MAINKFARVALGMLSLTMLVSFAAIGETVDDDVKAGKATDDAMTADSTAAGSAAADYSFLIAENGAAVFTQVLRWDSNQYALEYELEIHDAADAEVFKGRTPVSQQTVSLPAGSYLYRITIYNLLGKPEVAGEWMPLLIKKAVQPQVTSFNPAVLYLEDKNFSMTLRCKKLESGAQIFLVDPAFGLTKYEATIDKVDDDRIALSFPSDKLDSGNFLVKVVNPGGLFSSSQDILKVRYQDPFELFVTVGYTPMFPLYDSWYTGVWTKTIYPAGFISRISFIALKKRYGYFGVEAGASFRAFSGGETGIELKTKYTSVGLGFLYKYMLNDKIFFLFRAGPGITMTSLEFFYGTDTGESMGSVDLNASAGLSFQYLITKHWLAELGADYTNIFYKRQNTGFIAPQLSAGYMF